MTATSGGSRGIAGESVPYPFLAKIPEQLRDIARDLCKQGHPGLAGKLVAIAQRLDDYERLNAAGQSTAELARLRAVIKNVIPTQTNEEVIRWLKAALVYGLPIYQNINNRRIDID